MYLQARVDMAHSLAADAVTVSVSCRGTPLALPEKIAVREREQPPRLYTQPIV